MGSGFLRRWMLNLARALLLLIPTWAWAPSVSATHMSGGDPDIVAPFAAVGILLIILGLMLRLDMLHLGGERTSHRLGIGGVIAGILVILAGSAVAVVQVVGEEPVGGQQSTWLQAAGPLILLGFLSSVAAGLVLWWASRSGQFKDSEALAARVLQLEDEDEGRRR
jgi:cbb3-type cytochrome oxidase maturation protein